MNEIKKKIRTIQHWPKQGIMFRDITTLLKDAAGFKMVINEFYNRYKEIKIDKVAGIESRGFIIGSALADRLNVGFVPIRKNGKLPSKTISEEYDLEYGRDKIEIHTDAISIGENVLVADDLIATGGTALAACHLIKRAGGKVVECCFIVNLPELNGLTRLSNEGMKSFSLVEFKGA